MPLLELQQVAHSYSSKTTFSELSFKLMKGQIACLLGPSGCGKTTALRCIAGFEEISSGAILINNQLVSRAGFNQPAEQRQIGMIFQDYALFPHLNVARNISFGLFKFGAAQRQQRVDELLEIVGLSGYAKAYPHQLSGGQQQRVALARALAPRPALLLLDEPFSNLDVELRERLCIEIRTILKRQNSTAILVTHDQHEAFAMADEIGVMHQGSMQQWDSADQLYHQPSNRFVANFIGEGGFIDGQVINEHQIEIELGLVRNQRGHPRGSSIELLLRPDDIVQSERSNLRAKVVGKAFRGADCLYTLELPSGQRVLSRIPSHYPHAIDDYIGIELEIKPDVEHVITFQKSGISS
nr:ABC transporter ATP-binding protein [Solimicrobium silvestre]